MMRLYGIRSQELSPVLSPVRVIPTLTFSEPKLTQAAVAVACPGPQRARKHGRSDPYEILMDEKTKSLVDGK